MGIAAATATPYARSRARWQITVGVAAWLCGIASIAVVVWMIAGLFRVGWQNIVWVLSAASGSGIVGAMMWSAAILAIALPLAAAVSLCAAIAAADSSLGGPAGIILRTTLRFGATIPSVTIGIALLAAVGFNPMVTRSIATHPILAAALALVALNLPIMTARFRSVLRSVPREWRVAALAAGATHGDALANVTLRHALPRIVGVILTGAGQMLGETTVVAIVLSLSTNVSFVNRATTFAPAPLSVHLWQQLAIGHPDASSAQAVASETLLLLIAILVLRFAGRALLHRRRISGIGA